jgi:hypothetical protein
MPETNKSPAMRVRRLAQVPNERKSRIRGASADAFSLAPHFEDFFDLVARGPDLAPHFRSFFALVARSLSAALKTGQKIRRCSACLNFKCKKNTYLGMEGARMNLTMKCRATKVCFHLKCGVVKRDRATNTNFWSKCGATESLRATNTFF